MTNLEINKVGSTEPAIKFLQDIIKRIDGLQAIVISDKDGIPIVKETAQDFPESLTEPNFLSSVSFAVEQAGKLQSGKNKRIICMFETTQVIQFNKSPVMVSLIAEAKANTGLLLNLESEINELAEDLRALIDS